ncbi:DoxX-like family protein, partial [Aeromonas schubertii]|uniref:DoxX-like family protein n=1 Tax=Aeromonas schubertii TaxID=652 RepID=UPI0038B6B013
TGMSPTAGLVAEAFAFVPADVFFVGLGVWEIAVGLALLSRRTLRLAVVLLIGYAAVAMVPLVLFPGETFSYFPYGPSFE